MLFEFTDLMPKDIPLDFSPIRHIRQLTWCQVLACLIEKLVTSILKNLKSCSTKK